MTSTDSKKEYIKRWESYIDELWRLAFCNDVEISEKVRYHRDELKKLVPKIADIKSFKDE